MRNIDIQGTYAHVDKRLDFVSDMVISHHMEGSCIQS